MFKNETENKQPRIKDARKITDPAKLDTKGMIAAVLSAWDLPANGENKQKAADYLIRLGYGKLRATTKWARDNEAPAKKPAKKRTKKAAKKPAAKKADPAPVAVNG